MWPLPLLDVRSNHDAGYVTWFAVPRERLAIEAGADQLARYESSAHGGRSFCRRCGSSRFCESTLHPARVDIPLGAMHEPIDRDSQLHVFFDSRAPWVTVVDDLPRLGGKTGPEPQAEPKDEGVQ